MLDEGKRPSILESGTLYLFLLRSSSPYKHLVLTTDSSSVVYSICSFSHSLSVASDLQRVDRRCAAAQTVLVTKLLLHTAYISLAHRFRAPLLSCSPPHSTFQTQQATSASTSNCRVTAALQRFQTSTPLLDWSGHRLLHEASQHTPQKDRTVFPWFEKCFHLRLVDSHTVNVGCDVERKQNRSMNKTGDARGRPTDRPRMSR